MKQTTKPTKGRGAQVNTRNQFSKYDLDDSFFEDVVDEEELKSKPKTEFIALHPKTIVNKVPSPDIGMNWSINPYQGCEHGCTYCYARPTHEYWGYSAGMDFEQKVLYKPGAPKLLREFFDRKSWRPDTIVMSGNTDCYQPVERRFEITRQLMQVFLEYQNPVGVITKNALILRDLDIIKPLAEKNLIRVIVSLTTLTEETRRKLEPRTASVKNRLRVIRELSKAGVPVIAQMGPVIPGLTDHEIPEVVKAAAENGAVKMHYILVRLNGVVAKIFEDWVYKAFPDRANRILNNIRQTRGGELGSTRFGERMKGKGNFSDSIDGLFKMAHARYFPQKEVPSVSKDLFIRPSKGGQLSLFQ